MNRKLSKKALLVGINVYRPPITLLHGCVNDTHQLKEILTQRYDFASEKIRLLLDSDATRQNILDNLDWLVSGAQPGDVLVFAYSGHGSQVDDDSGDEWECRDEILIPYDHSWAKPLRDDDLKCKFDRVPMETNLTFICDSCHSGSVNKAADTMQTPRVIMTPPEIQRRIAEKIAARDLGFKEFVRQRYRDFVAQTPRDQLESKIDQFLSDMLNIYKVNRYQFVNTHENNVLLAACQDVQTSADAYIAGEWHGAFTFYLGNAVAKGGAALTYRQMIVEASKGLLHYEQTPQLECPEAMKDLPLFSSLEAMEMAF